MNNKDLIKYLNLNKFKSFKLKTILIIKSMYIGIVKKIFYNKCGINIKKGDILCVIEYLAIDIEIISEFDATISCINIVENQFVEYGTSLFYISVII